MPQSTTHDGRNDNEMDADLPRLAALIGDGQIPFPNDRTEDELTRLAKLVRQHRRSSLLDFLAQVVASDLNRESNGGTDVGRPLRADPAHRLGRHD